MPPCMALCWAVTAPVTHGSQGSLPPRRALSWAVSGPQERNCHRSEQNPCSESSCGGEVSQWSPLSAILTSPKVSQRGACALTHLGLALPAAERTSHGPGRPVREHASDRLLTPLPPGRRGNTSDFARCPRDEASVTQIQGLSLEE